MVNAIVGLLVVALLLGALGPTIFQNLSAFATNGNLSATEKAVAAVLGVFVIIGILYGILKLAGVKFGK